VPYTLRYRDEMPARRTSKRWSWVFLLRISSPPTSNTAPVRFPASNRIKISRLETLSRNLPRVRGSWNTSIDMLYDWFCGAQQALSPALPSALLPRCQARSIHSTTLQHLDLAGRGNRYARRQRAAVHAHLKRNDTFIYTDNATAAAFSVNR